MREIKFRAWNSKMRRMFTAQEMTDDQMALLPSGYFANIHSSDVRLTVVYPKESMLPLQYTGLTDKYGKEMYEGDLLRWIDWEEELTEEPDVYRVDWLDKEARFSLNCFRNGKQLDPKDDVFQPGDEFEVIGNIYENAELLEERQ